MTRIWYPLQDSIKMKRYSLEIVGKNESEHLLCKGNMSPLNMTLIYCSCQVLVILTSSPSFLGFGKYFFLSFDYIVTRNSDHILSQMLPNSRVVSPIFSREVLFAVFLPLIHCLNFLPQS